ncbi:MAG: hypothetical protein M3340_05510 [Actinomycetota bacterium]|nr:hypothetical protein [Actinomycetota bacterium]
MTLLEFLNPIRNAGRKEQVLGVLYYFKHFEDTSVLSVGEIREGLKRARVPQAKTINISDALNEAVPYADRVGPRGVWAITDSGEEFVRQLPLPVQDTTGVQHQTTALEMLAARQQNEAVRGYIEEALKCLSVDALRAAVVFLWTGAARTLQENALGKGTALNAALQKHDPKARRVTKVDDFAWIKDRNLLLACGELGLLDKGERGTLEDALNLRNRCGHPTRYKPGVARVSSFIEDVVGIVWP